MALAFPFGTVVQYIVIAFFGYVLIGAPSLSSILGGSSDSTSTGRSEKFGYETKTEIRRGSVGHVEIGRNGEVKEVQSCPDHGYKTHIFHRDPLVIYIEDFVSKREMDHIIDISEKAWQPSSVWTAGKERLDESVRKSEKAGLNATDSTVACVSERARRFQGFRPGVFVEQMWSQRYARNGHYMYHYDYSNPSATSGRVSSFMVYLDANCTGGGTNFPRLERPSGSEWCRFVECGEGSEVLRDGKGEEVRGTTFKAIKGNAVFWENLRSDGSGYPETYHAGLPVREGVKIGLNIWSWFEEGYRGS